MFHETNSVTTRRYISGVVNLFRRINHQHFYAPIKPVIIKQVRVDYVTLTFDLRSVRNFPHNESEAINVSCFVCSKQVRVKRTGNNFGGHVPGCCSTSGIIVRTEIDFPFLSKIKGNFTTQHRYSTCRKQSNTKNNTRRKLHKYTVNMEEQGSIYYSKKDTFKLDFCCWQVS